jgi:hypothetical protein
VLDVAFRDLDAGYEVVPNGAVVTVQIVNNTDQIFDASYVDVTLNYGAGGHQAERAFVSNENINGFEGSVPPGGTATAEFGFEGVEDHSAFVIGVEPDWSEYGTAFWGSQK